MSLVKYLISRWRKPRQVRQEVVTTTVLTQAQYEELQKRLPGPGLTHGEKAEHYAFNLGVQYALAELRKGFVHGENN